MTSSIKKRLTLPAKENVLTRNYLYTKVEPKPLSVLDPERYRGLSLSEISDRFGKSEAKHIYDTAVICGLNLATVKPVELESVEKIYVVDICIEMSGDIYGNRQYVATLSPNRYCGAIQSLQLKVLTVDSSIGEDVAYEYLMGIVSNEILREGFK